MSSFSSGINVSLDEYFERQKSAEETCRKGIKNLIIQSLAFVVIAIVSHVIGYYLLPSFFIFFGLVIFLSICMAIGSLFMIRKQIKTYKFQLERIVDYMMSGGIAIEIPVEDYEKFDLFKTKKKRFKSKSISQLKDEESVYKAEKQQERERLEYEQQVEKQFREQYFSDESDENN